MDLVNICASQLAIPVKQDVAEEITTIVNDTMTQIIRDASAFMRHSNRDVLTPEDIDGALRMRQMDPVYGYAARRGGILRHIGQVEDDSARATGVYMPEDELLDLERLMDEEAGGEIPLIPELAREPTLTLHWLAIDGAQPNVPQNPNAVNISAAKAAASAVQEVLGTNLSLLDNSAAGVVRKRRRDGSDLFDSDDELEAWDTSSESDEDGEDDDGASEDEEEDRDSSLGMDDKVKEEARRARRRRKRKRERRRRRKMAEALKASAEPEVKPLVKHSLMKEQTLFLIRVTSAILGDDAHLRRLALQSLSSEEGLHQLTPYLSQFVVKQTVLNLRHLQRLTALMQTAHCLLTSPAIHIEPYLHQLMPAVMTCLVSKRLCDTAAEDHWALRDFTADIVANVCRRFGSAYSNLQPRITKLLTRAWLDPSRPLTTHYGAIVGLTALGPYVVRVLMLPYLRDYLELLRPVMREARNPTKRAEACKCFGALLQATGGYIRHEFQKNSSIAAVAAASIAAAEAEAASAMEQVAAAAAAVKEAEEASATAAAAVEKVAKTFEQKPATRKRRRGRQPAKDPSDDPAAMLEAAEEEAAHAQAQLLSRRDSVRVKQEDAQAKMLRLTHLRGDTAAGRLLQMDSPFSISELFDIFGEALLPYLRSGAHILSRRSGGTASAGAPNGIALGQSILRSRATDGTLDLAMCIL